MLSGCFVEDLIQFYTYVIKERYRKGQTWATRVLERIYRKTVRMLTKNIWIVQGIPELGDAYNYYEVSLQDGKFRCSCFSHSWGSRRRQEMCTHVGAVIVLHELCEYLRRFKYIGFVKLSNENMHIVEACENCKIIKTTDSTFRRLLLVLSNNENATFLVCDRTCKSIDVQLEDAERFLKELLSKYCGAGAGIRTRE